MLDWITGTSRSRTRTACASSPPSAAKAMLPMLIASGPTRKGSSRSRGRAAAVPREWATAQSALRYLGWTKDPERWRASSRSSSSGSNKKLDVTMDSLMQGGLAILGMTLRALGVGAADGFAQWGDSKAYPDLVKYIEDPMENEQSRIEACFALSWVATDDQMKEVVKKVHDFTKPDPQEPTHPHLLPRDAHPPPGARRDGGAHRPPEAATSTSRCATRWRAPSAFGGITREHDRSSSSTS